MNINKQSKKAGKTTNTYNTNIIYIYIYIYIYNQKHTKQ